MEHGIAEIESNVTKKSCLDTQFQQQEISQLKLQISQLENYSRRYNIIVKGIAETANEKIDELEEKIMHLFTEVMDFSPYIDVIHRLGKPVQGNTRPIIIRFASQRDKATVFSFRPQFYKKAITIHHHFSPDIQKTRTNLFTLARQQFPNSIWTGFIPPDKRFIDGQKYYLDESKKLTLIYSQQKNDPRDQNWKNQ